jgi:CRISPR type I-E-associated protein CasB/Cse2
MRQLAAASGSGSGTLDCRVAILLSSSGERLQHHLRQIIGQLASREIPVDFAVLLRDLLHWDHRERWVQRSWARGFWDERERASVTDKEPA